MSWTFHFPVKIRFETDAYESISSQVGERRALLVSTEGFQKRGGGDKIEASLGDRLVGTICCVTPNPDVEEVARVCAIGSQYQFDVLIAIGGGSVIDTAKIFVAGMGSWGDCPEAMRVFLAQGGKVPSAGLKSVIAVPTTSGTGSEATPFATVWDNRLRKKFSIDGDGLYPEAAILDPKLTYDLPEEQTIATGLDAVSQALESIWNKRANPITMVFATESLKYSLTALPRLVADFGDAGARRDMMLASLLAGIAISQTRTGIAHSISYPLTAHYGLIHGLACSFTLPEILVFNLRYDDGRLARLAQSLGLAAVDELVVKLRDLLDTCQVNQRLRKCLPSAAAVLAISGEMNTPGRADNNMTPLAPSTIKSFLEQGLASTWP
jgi:alcohol dehydrogenase